MKTDTEAVIDAFGKNEPMKKVFWAQFVAMAGLVLAWVRVFHDKTLTAAILDRDTSGTDPEYEWEEFQKEPTRTIFIKPDIFLMGKGGQI